MDVIVLNRKKSPGTKLLRDPFMFKNVLFFRICFTSL